MSTITTFAEAFAAIKAIAEERGDSVHLSMEAWYDSGHTITLRRAGGVEQTTVQPARVWGVGAVVYSSRTNERYQAPTFDLVVGCYREREADWERLVARRRAQDVIDGGGEMPEPTPERADDAGDLA